MIPSSSQILWSVLRTEQKRMLYFSIKAGYERIMLLSPAGLNFAMRNGGKLKYLPGNALNSSSSIEPGSSLTAWVWLNSSVSLTCLCILQASLGT